MIWYISIYISLTWLIFHWIHYLQGLVIIWILSILIFSILHLSYKILYSIQIIEFIIISSILQRWKVMGYHAFLFKNFVYYFLFDLEYFYINFLYINFRTSVLLRYSSINLYYICSSNYHWTKHQVEGPLVN